MARMGRPPKHSGCINGKSSRLYTCWLSMKVRAKRRVSCKVYPEWINNFAAFSKWALSNGYTDLMVLSRAGDIGDYTPTNASWVTDAVNQAEANVTNAKTVHLMFKGELIEITNMRQYCKGKNLDQRHMGKVVSGKAKSHKGYTAP